MKKHRILVCGGRAFGSSPYPYNPNINWETAFKIAKKQKEFVYRVLDAALNKFEIECIIHGAARGADKCAGDWAKDRGINWHEYPALWKTHGKAAGILRNQTMLTETNPTLVIAFPGGTGTNDMMRRARNAGVRVIEVKF